MTTVTTPMEIESRSPRPVLLAVVSVLFGAAIGLGVGTLIDSDNAPATADPAPAVAEGVSGSDASGVDFRLSRLLEAEVQMSRSIPAVASGVDFRLSRLLEAEVQMTRSIPAVASGVDSRLSRLLEADGAVTAGVPAVASGVDSRLERLIG